MIRYRISDSLVLKAADEGSPYPFTRAVGLLGRNEDILWFEDGSGNKEFLHPLAIEGFCIEGLLDYQFRQVGKDAFEMYAEISGSASEEDVRMEMLGQMRQILLEKKLLHKVLYSCRNLPDSCSVSVIVEDIGIAYGYLLLYWQENSHIPVNFRWI